MRISALVVGLLLSSSLLLADDRSINVDDHIDFSTLKTFAMQEGKVTSQRPEISNALIVKQIGDAIRAELTAKGLTETSTGPDAVVDWSITGVDYSIGPYGRENRIPPGFRGGYMPVSFTEATLVIDLAAGHPKTLVWHGVYHDPKDTASKIAQKLPSDVKKLLSEYPPKKKR